MGFGVSGGLDFASDGAKDGSGVEEVGKVLVQLRKREAERVDSKGSAGFGEVGVIFSQKIGQNLGQRFRSNGNCLKRTKKGC